MRLSHDEVKRRLFDETDSGNAERAIFINPRLNLSDFISKKSTAIDCRLGRWFLEKKISGFKANSFSGEDETLHKYSMMHEKKFINFGKEYVLHSGQSCLAITLEWFGFPADVGGRIDGKSSLARHFLQVQLASNVHPGFFGCLTLEITNYGPTPIYLEPGMPIGQVVFYKITGASGVKTSYGGNRFPTVFPLRKDIFMERLDIKSR